MQLTNEQKIKIEKFIKHCRARNGIVNLRGNDTLMSFCTKPSDSFEIPGIAKDLGFIRKHETHEPNAHMPESNVEIYRLTEKGWAFKSFRHEWLKNWKINHPIWSGIISAVFSALLSLIVGYILWQADNQSKNQEMREVKEQAKRANDRIDSLNSVQMRKDSMPALSASATGLKSEVK